MKIRCPACNTEYEFSKLGLLKLMRRPKCERCGADLLEVLKEPTISEAGYVTCPRCAQAQEPAEHCKWCGAPMGESKGKPRTPFPVGPERRGGEEKVVRGSGLKKVVGLLPIALFALSWLAVSDLPRQIYRAYLTSVPVVKESRPLKEAVGGKIQYGPIPLFFKQEIDASQGIVRASMYFWVGGPDDSTMVCARLLRSGKPEDGWRVTEDSYFHGKGGKEVPLMEGMAPREAEDPGAKKGASRRR